MLNGLRVPQINADVTGGAVDLTKASRLAENSNVAFMGDTKGGAFDIPGDRPEMVGATVQPEWPGECQCASAVDERNGCHSAIRG
jgi:hypothetical protein